MTESESKLKHPIKKIALLVATLAAIGIVFLLLRDYLNFEYLASIEAELKSFKQRNLALTLLVAFLIYVAVTGCSLPFATVLTLLYAWFFGFVESVVLISFASTTGATVAFLMSRYFARDFVQKTFGDRFKKINDAFKSEGAYYLFTLRLAPIFPFYIVNILMALTTVKTRTFWWVSQLGMLPGTIVYCFLGSQVSSLDSIANEGIKVNPWLLVAFVILGIFPLAIRLVVKRLRPKKTESDQ